MLSSDIGFLVYLRVYGCTLVYAGISANVLFCACIHTCVVRRGQLASLIGVWQCDIAYIVSKLRTVLAQHGLGLSG